MSVSISAKQLLCSAGPAELAEVEEGGFVLEVSRPAINMNLKGVGNTTTRPQCLVFALPPVSRMLSSLLHLVLYVNSYL